MKIGRIALVVALCFCVLSSCDTTKKEGYDRGNQYLEAITTFKWDGMDFFNDYNLRGDVVKVIDRIYRLSEESDTILRISEFGDNNRLLKMRTIMDGTEDSERLCHYDKAGNIVDVRDEYKDQVLVTRFYYNQGLLSHRDVYKCIKRNGDMWNLLGVDTFIYDTDTHLSKIISTPMLPIEKYETVFEYENGRLRMEKTTDSNIYFDEKGCMEKYVATSSEDGEPGIRYAGYNGNSDLIVISGKEGVSVPTIDSCGTKEFIEKFVRNLQKVGSKAQYMKDYQYDRQGNWTLKITGRSGEALVEERKIIYRGEEDGYTLPSFVSLSSVPYSVYGSDIHQESPKYSLYDEQDRLVTEVFQSSKDEYRYEGKNTIKTSSIIIPDTTIENYYYNDAGESESIETYKGGSYYSRELFYYANGKLDSSVVTYKGSNRRDLKLYDDKGHVRMDGGDRIKCDDRGNIIELEDDYSKETTIFDEKNRIVSVKSHILQDGYQSDMSMERVSVKDSADGWEAVYKRSDRSGLLVIGKKIDQQGKVIEETLREEQFLMEKKSHEYTQDGKKDRVVICRMPWKAQGIDLANTPVIREWFDENGKVLKKQFFNQLMQPTTRYEYTYDADGSLLMEECFDRFGQSLRKIDYK